MFSPHKHMFYSLLKKKKKNLCFLQWMIPQFLLFSLQLDIILWVVFGNKYKLHHLLLLFFLWLALIVNVKYFTIFFWFSWDLGAHSIYIHCPFCHHNQTNVSNSTLFDLTSKGRAVLHKHINFSIITSQIYVIYPKQFSIISSHIYIIYPIIMHRLLSFINSPFLPWFP